MTEPVVLAAGELEARFVPGAGMVGTSLRHRGEELLGRRRGLAAYVEQGKTFGIPLLHPWANRLAASRFEVAGVEVDAGASPRSRADDHGLPIHGLLAAWPHWEVREATATTLEAQTDLGAHEEVLRAFPFPHVLAVRVTLEAAALTVATTVRATGERPVPVAFGWHPYLVVPGLPRARWRVELPARRRLAADARGIPTGGGEAEPAEAFTLGERTFDDGYDDLGDPPEFGLAGGGRRLALRFGAGYPVAQVFAPPGQDLIAFEPMTAPTNALAAGTAPLVAPGDAFTASFSIAVADG